MLPQTTPSVSNKFLSASRVHFLQDIIESLRNCRALKVKAMQQDCLEVTSI